MSAATDRNLLFGILALQMDFITRDQLVSAMNAWVLNKAKPLDALLLEQKALAADTHAVLDTLVQKHLALHENDPEKSLAAVSSVGAVKHDLAKIADADVQASLVRVAKLAKTANDPKPPVATGSPEDPFATVGLSTSTGLRFRILRPHAHGGLGEVFAAHDEELRREVALKQIRPQHADDAEARSRFLLEAEITGGLEHPGIVPVYGLGQYADGRPFYAMRFIKGDSLKDAIERYHATWSAVTRGGARGPTLRSADAASRLNSLEFRKLLGRFIAVCEAIQYAHDRGVIHRDLKPSNIMLGKYGETLVVDWGLAKAMGNRPASPGAFDTELRDPDATALATDEPPLLPTATSEGSETLPGSAVGTPSFMSPEQAAGRLDQLGPASDIYGLGATLYALLTGKAPVEDKDVAVVLKRVREGNIRGPREVAPEIDRAMDAICMKATALKPADRYATCRALADDLERWLAGKPVSAWPEPWTVRAKRWARQHQTLVTSTAASVFIALVGLAVGLFWHQDEQNRRTTEVAVRKAEAARKREQAEDAIRRALDKAEQSRQALHTILSAPGGVFGLLNDPARWQGHVQAALGAVERARALLANSEEGVDRALAERAERLETALRADEADRLLAERLEKIRVDRIGIVGGRFSHAGAAKDYPRAFADAGFDVQRERAEPVSARLRNSLIREQLVAALDRWAWTILRYTEDDKVAEHLLHVARLAAPDPVWGDRLRQIAVWRDQPALSQLVRAQLAKKTPEVGLSPPLLDLIGKLLDADNPLRPEWLRRAQADYPGDFWLNFELAQAIRKTNPDESAGFYRVAIAVRPGSCAPYNNLGNIFRGQRKFPEAIAVFNKAIALDARYALAHGNLGGAFLEQNMLPEAIAEFKKAINIDPNYADAYASLSNAFRAQKKMAEASVAINKSLKLDAESAFAHNALGNLRMDQRRLPEAVDAFHEAIRLDPKFSGAYHNLGNAYSKQGKLPEAIEAYQKAIACESTLHNSYIGLGKALLRVGRFAEAADAHQKCLDLLPKDTPSGVLKGVKVELDQCQRWLALEKRLPRFQAGAETATPYDVSRMARMCQEYKKRYVTAVQLYRQAFQADPALVLRRDLPRRYNAACAAALAAAGQGDDAAKLSDEEKARLRDQAHAWLRAELDDEASRQKAGDGRAVLNTDERLAHWRKDPDLATIRDAKPLAALPEPEQAEWRKFWADVEKHLGQVRSQISEATLQGELSDERTEQIHEMKLEAGKACVIDMKSSDLDSYLKLYDPAGELVAENDDFTLGNFDSRIVYMPKESGVYRIAATSFKQRGRGAYTLTIRAVAGR